MSHTGLVYNKTGGSEMEERSTHRWCAAGLSCPCPAALRKVEHSRLSLLEDNVVLILRDTMNSYQSEIQHVLQTSRFPPPREAL